MIQCNDRNWSNKIKLVIGFLCCHCNVTDGKKGLFLRKTIRTQLVAMSKTFSFELFQFLSFPKYRTLRCIIIWDTGYVKVKILTTGFWGKEAWRPTPKWNTRFFFAFSKRTQLWLAKLRQPTGQTFFPTFPKEFSHFLQT